MSLRGRVAIATGRTALARACALRIRRERMPWGDVLAALLEAGIADDPHRWRAAATAADACAMRLHAAAARAHAGDAPTVPATVIAALAPATSSPCS